VAGWDCLVGGADIPVSPNTRADRNVCPTNPESDRLSWSVY
jgi:hypothetical protein